ncbi:MAG: DUF3050 domain-containing protein [Brevibacillus sp.]|nr:DUF3050 domain-containing protein [Brevibacillus sp.]
MNNIRRIRDELLQHPVYRAVNTPERVRIFMQYHVFAVWDFMSLLKRLQRDLTCTDVPWVPARHAHYARFINEIVLGEETDEDGQGGYASHFELYVEAMKECGADTVPIERFLAELQAGRDPLAALRAAEVPESVFRFVHHTLELAQHGGTYYLKRHIELDGDEHGPLAERLLTALCENSPEKQAEAERTAEQSLRARIELWNGVLAAL